MTAATLAGPAAEAVPAIPAPALEARIPAELLYWGLLPAEARRRSAQALRYRFERLLPVPVERLHTAAAALPDGRVLMVGIEPERLRGHLAARADIGPGTWALVPDRLPDHLATLGLDPAPLARLDLLRGAFEPAPRRRLRLLGAALLHGGLALAAALALVGIERRAAALDEHAALLRRTGQELLARALPAQAGAASRPELRLTMELRTLEQAARSPAAAGGDVAAALEQLWRAWPTDLRVQAETVTATGERIVVRGAVPGLADAERLARACATLATPTARYRAEPLQAQSGEHGATFLLTLVRQGAAGAKR